MKRPIGPLLAFAAGILFYMTLAPGALAQQAAPSEFATFRLFEGDSVELSSTEFQRLAGMVRRGLTPGNCPLGRLRMRVPEGDQLFQEALIGARRGAVLAALDGLGLPAAGRLFVETAVFGDAAGHDTVYEIWRDQAPPTLRVRSEPREGTKVRPNQPIVLRIVAADDADRWQTGIKTIRLVAESDGGHDVDPTPIRFDSCSDPQEKSGQVTYRVPSDAPPVVRLTVLVEDHAGHVVKESAEFPTGDFYGTLSVESANRYFTRADIVLNHDGNGNLTGTMVGQLRHLDGVDRGCTYRTVRPNDFRVSLVGAYTEGRSLKVFINEIQETGLTAEAMCQGPWWAIGPPGGWTFKMGVWTPREFLGTPSPLGEGQVFPDGTRQYEVEHPPTRWTVTLRRARD